MRNGFDMAVNYGVKFVVLQFSVGFVLKRKLSRPEKLLARNLCCKE